MSGNAHGDREHPIGKAHLRSTAAPDGFEEVEMLEKARSFVDDDGAPDLVLCTDAHAACTPSRVSCSAFERSARFGLLHELAHVWLVENLTDDGRAEFLALTGAPSWRGHDTPWHRRGVEGAAERIAWGLMDETVRLVRLDNPPCDQTAALFVQLTRTAPLVGCEA